MKRGTPLTRTALLRRTPMRRSRVASARAKPLKPRRRTKAERDAWKTLKQLVWIRDKGTCQRCGRPGTDAHHLLPKGRGGKDELSNLVILDRECHDWAHGHSKQAERDGWLRGTRA